MNLPGFTAEASLYGRGEIYSGIATFDHSDRGIQPAVFRRVCNRQCLNECRSGCTDAACRAECFADCCDIVP